MATLPEHLSSPTGEAESAYPSGALEFTH
jgi:hypothetical protein